MKWVVLGLLAVGAAVAVLYWQATSDLAERYRTVVARASALGVTRAGQVPDETAVRGHLEEAARQAGLELADLEVEVGRGKLGVAAGLQQAAGAQGAALAALPAFGTTLVMKGRLRGKKWLWKLERAFEAKAVLKGELTPDEGAPATSADRVPRYDE